MVRTRLIQSVLVLAVGLAAVLPAAGGTYADGSKINLVTARGAVGSASQGGWGDGGPRAPLHGGYSWEYRSGAYTGADIWWKAELPDVYSVSDYTIAFYSYPYQVRDFEVQTSLTGLDGDWQTQATYTGNTSAIVSGGFTAVDAEFLRIYGTAFQDNSYGMILQKVRFTGPNDPAVSPRFSVAQSTWAGAGVTGAGWSDVGQAIDDGTANNWNYGAVAGATNISPLVVTLNDLYRVDAIGITNFNPDDNRAVRDMDVYVSASASGDADWILAAELRDIPRSDALGRDNHQDFMLNGTYDAKRVRFDVLRNYDNPSQTYINELYVYPAPEAAVLIPEPATMALLGLGGLAVFTRRRRGGRAARKRQRDPH